MTCKKSYTVTLHWESQICKFTKSGFSKVGFYMTVFNNEFGA